jgi:hypothetical protein
MATITQNAMVNIYGPVTVAAFTLTASDTFTYISGAKQTLYLENTTAGSLTVLITGSGATSVSPAGLGGAVTTSGGFSVTLAAGAKKSIALDHIASYLSGTITMTGGTGITATLFV